MRDPDDFKPDSFRRTSREHEGKRYDVIMGKLKDGDDSMVEQTYRYPKDIWDTDDARRHCKSHHGISFEPASEENAAPAIIEKHFHADIKKKSEQDGHLIIEGWASTKAVDRADEVVEPEAFTNGIAAYLDNPILRYQHEPGAIGKTLSATIDPLGGFWIKAMLSKAKDVEDIVTKIKEGILKAFSIGFRPIGEPEIVDGISHWKALELYEVSIVDIPCNRECLFSVAKGVQYGNDIVYFESELARDIEMLKTKIAALPANLQPDGKAAPVVIPASIPEERYGAFLKELDRATTVMKNDELDRFLERMKG